MIEPNPSLHDDAPIQVTSSRVLFPDDRRVHRKAPSLARLDTGRLLLTFSMNEGSDSLEGAVVLTESEDEGATWSEPRVVYDAPGWTCLNLGGLVRFSDEMIRLIIGRVKIDRSLGGDEPFYDWFTTFMDSRDGGRTWTEPGEELKLFPLWTEAYGQSNPHPLPDGRFLLAAIGTMGRDEQWHSGVSIVDPNDGYSVTMPVIIAHDPERNYSDTDVARLDDGRLLAVVREHNLKRSVFSHSEDDGRTWTPLRYTGFMGANFKLQRLNSGAVVCVYRDEEPSRRGVSVSVTEDGGETWRLAGQLYVSHMDPSHVPSLVCGYPDLAYLDDRRMIGVLHTYPDDGDRMYLQQFELLDVS